MRTRQTAIAAFFAVSTVLSMGVPQDAVAQPAPAAPAPAAGDVAQAKAHFEKALGLYQASNFAGALEEFRESYKNVNSPNSHLYIARCMRDLGRLVDAYLEYDKVAAEAKGAGEKYAQTGEQAAAERDELNAKLARVNVMVMGSEPGAQLMIGGVEVPADHQGKPFPAMPGTIEVKLSAPSKSPVTQSVSAAAGETKDVNISFPTSDSGTEQPGGSKFKMTPMKIGAFAAAGLGVVGFVTFAAAGSASQATYDKLLERCGNDPCPEGLAGDIDTGKTQQTIANVGLVVGIVGLAAGATLFVIDMKKNKAADQTQTTLLIGPGSFGVRGTF